MQYLVKIRQDINLLLVTGSSGSKRIGFSAKRKFLHENEMSIYINLLNAVSGC